MEKAFVIDKILSGEGWLTHKEVLYNLRSWAHWSSLLSAAANLRRDRLYTSRRHGETHIERVLILGALSAMEADLSQSETELFLDACAYHDVGRVNDWYDLEHGYRSALQVGEITGREGRELDILKLALHAHSRSDSEMLGLAEKYGLSNDEFALNLCRMLKDADNLDRFRIGDFDPRYLRFEYNKKYVDLAHDMAKLWYPQLEK